MVNTVGCQDRRSDHIAFLPHTVEKLDQRNLPDLSVLQEEKPFNVELAAGTYRLFQRVQGHNKHVAGSFRTVDQNPLSKKTGLSSSFFAMFASVAKIDLDILCYPLICINRI